MKKIKRYHSIIIKSWNNDFENEPRAIAAVEEDGWFNVAINCVRDGDMGKLGLDGVYSRTWGTDWADENDLRPASEEEVEKYLNHIPMEWIIGDMDSIEEVNIIRINGATHIIWR